MTDQAIFFEVFDRATTIMIKELFVLACIFASLSVEAKPICPAKTNQECASQFAKNMTKILKEMRAGRDPFELVAVTSSGSDVTMVY